MMDYTKVCTVCQIEFPATKAYFHKSKKSKYGFHSQCKQCRKITENKRYKTQKDKHKIKNKTYYEKNKKQILEQVKEYSLKNKEKISQAKKKYYESNREEKIKKVCDYQKNNRTKINEYRRTKEKTDLLFKLSNICRGRIREVLKNNKQKKSIEYLGTDIQSYKDYLENLFTEGMNWNNYGIYGWHIDHIIPLSSAKNTEELISLLHYTNTQPLWAKDNWSKSNKLN